jgi:cysteine desulfurase
MTNQSVYLDNQGSTPVDPRVRATLLAALDKVGNPAAVEHAFGWETAEIVETARSHIASALGADPEEITFTAGATEANNIAVLGAALAAPPDRRRILISAIEHKSVSEAARACVPLGYTVELVPASGAGLIEPGALAAAMGADVAVVSVAAVNNEIGTIQPVHELAAIARAWGAFFHSDGAQALPACAVDLGALALDGFTVSGHKIYAPAGIGALYVARDAPWRPKPLLFGGGQERGLRPGSLSAPLCAALSEAITILAAEGAPERKAVAALRDRFTFLLRRAHPDMLITCTDTPRHPGSLHARFPGVKASDLLMRLQPVVAASTGSACTSGMLQPSHVALAIGMDAEAADECVRFSLGRFTTETEIEIAADAIDAALIRAAA